MEEANILIINKSIRDLKKVFRYDSDLQNMFANNHRKDFRPQIIINEVDGENYISGSRRKESPKVKLSAIMDSDDYNNFDHEQRVQPKKSQFFGKGRLELDEACEVWNLSYNSLSKKIQKICNEEIKNDLNYSDNELSNLGSYRSNVNNIDTGRGFLPEG